MKSIFTKYLLVGLVLVALVLPCACAKPAPVEFEVSSLLITPTEAVPAEPVTISVNVNNTGGTEGTYPITLTLNGVKAQTKVVKVAPETTEKVSFIVTKEEAGTYNVEVDGLSGTFRLLKLAEFAVSNLVITPTTAEVGQVVTAAVDVTNTGEVKGSYTTILTVDGLETERKNVTVAPGATKAVTFSLIKGKAGRYQVAIGDLNSSLVVKEKESVFLEKINITPDYTQTDPAYGGLPGGGRQYCCPVSVSNSVMWLSNNGFPNLTSHSGDRKKDQFDVAFLLGSSAYMNTGLKGTGPNQLCNGLKKYILDKGYTYKRLKSQGWRYTESEFDTGEDVINLEWVKRGIKGYGSVWLNIGWYTYNSVADEYTRIGGHWITLVGYGHNGSSLNPDYLIAHDPASRAGTTFANEYILPVRINSGTLKGAYTGLPRSAVGFYKMTDGMHISSRADFGILDVVIVLETQP